MRKMEGNRKKKKWGRKVMKTEVLKQLGPGFILETEDKVCVFWGGGLSQAEVYHKLRRLMNKGRAG